MKKKPVILVVDDFVQTVDLVKLTLSNNLDCDILTAGTGKTAIEVTLKHHPDIILLDISLPGIDGFEVCNKIYSQKGFDDIPIIFLSGKVNNQDIVMGLNTGAVDYITKPFYPKELVARVKIHLKIRSQQQLIQQQYQQNSELLQVLCHDLMNPIGSLSGLLSLGDDDPSIVMDNLKMVNDSVDNLVEMISLVRELKSIDDGVTRLNLIPIDLKDAVNNSLEVLNSRMQQKGITPRISIPENLKILAEKTSLINSVISNLITNAIKFSYPDNSIIIHAEEQDSDYINLTIEDKGIGIPSDILPHLFDLHSRTSRSGTQNETGTGYGLPLVQKFVNLYGGEISVKSVEERDGVNHHGTKILLTLKKA